MIYSNDLHEILKAINGINPDCCVKKQRTPEGAVSLDELMREAQELYEAINGADGEPSLHGFGVKHDDGKPDWSLMPFEALEPVVRVLEHGARKYGPENWRDVPDAERRYWNAAQRHMLAHLQGDSHDEESGLPHLAHAVCSLLFILSLEFDHD